MYTKWLIPRSYQLRYKYMGYLQIVAYSQPALLESHRLSNKATIHFVP